MTRDCDNCEWGRKFGDDPPYCIFFHRIMHNPKGCEEWEEKTESGE